MQSCARQSVSKVARILVYGQHNYHSNSTNKNMTTQQQQDHGLICSEWEEAIIKEQRTPDLPFDSMQKDTIDQIHNHKNDYKQQSNGMQMMHPSN
jgi:hypothetical protein